MIDCCRCRCCCCCCWDSIGTWGKSEAAWKRFHFTFPAQPYGHLTLSSASTCSLIGPLLIPTLLCSSVLFCSVLFVTFCSSFLGFFFYRLLGFHWWRTADSGANVEGLKIEGPPTWRALQLGIWRVTAQGLEMVAMRWDWRRRRHGAVSSGTCRTRGWPVTSTGWCFWLLICSLGLPEITATEPWLRSTVSLLSPFFPSNPVVNWGPKSDCGSCFLLLSLIRPWYQNVGLVSCVLTLFIRFLLEIFPQSALDELIIFFWSVAEWGRGLKLVNRSERRHIHYVAEMQKLGRKNSKGCPHL